MTEKTAISVPVFPPRIARCSAQDLTEMRNYTAYHLQLCEGELVAAEGLNFSSSFSPATTVYASRNKLFVQDYDNGNIIDVFAGYKYDNSQVVKRILPHYAENGSREDYVVTTKRVFRIKDGTVYECAPFGGVCAAALGERMVVGMKCRIYYSAPLDWTDWNADNNGNYFDLQAEGGNIVDAVTFRDKLYLFRERGEVTRFTMSGEEFNAKATSLNCPGGKFYGGSAQVCGDKIYFLTERGLFSFNGTVFRREEDKISASLRRQIMYSCTAHGKYYACYSEEYDGLYCFDPLTGKAHLIAQKLSSVASNGTLYGMQAGDLYEVTGSGRSALEYSDASSEGMDFGLPGKEKILESVTVEGEGGFTLELTSDSSDAVSAEGECGKRIVISALRGREFGLHITFRGEFSLRGIVFRFREVTL